MTGACLARAGFNRKAAYATVAMTLAAEATRPRYPLGVRRSYRSFPAPSRLDSYLLGLPLEAAVVVGVIWLLALPKSLFQTSNRADPLGPALLFRIDRPTEPSPARLDQQLRPTSLFPVQSPLVCGLLCLHLRTRPVPHPRCGSRCSSFIRADRQRDRRPQTRLQGTELGHLRLAGYGLTLGPPLCRAPEGHSTRSEQLLQRRQCPARGGRPLPDQPIPLADRRRNPHLLPGLHSRHLRRHHLQRQRGRHHLQTTYDPSQPSPPNKAGLARSTSTGRNGPSSPRPASTRTVSPPSASAICASSKTRRSTRATAPCHSLAPPTSTPTVTSSVWNFPVGISTREDRSGQPLPGTKADKVFEKQYLGPDLVSPVMLKSCKYLGIRCKVLGTSELCLVKHAILLHTQPQLAPVGLGLSSAMAQQ